MAIYSYQRFYPYESSKFVVEDVLAIYCVAPTGAWTMRMNPDEKLSFSVKMMVT
jgi:hypothetical protein